jgi:Fe-S-cluster containining protein
LGALDALRLRHFLGGEILDHVEPVRWSRDMSLAFCWPFKLQGERWVFLMRRDAGHCNQLRDPGMPSSGCGAYSVRPAICRFFPFLVQDGLGLIPGGTPHKCPTGWLQDSTTQALVAEQSEKLRKDQIVERAIVRFWNKGKRERTLEVFTHWLEEHVAEQLVMPG